MESRRRSRFWLPSQVFSAQTVRIRRQVTFRLARRYARMLTARFAIGLTAILLSCSRGDSRAGSVPSLSPSSALPAASAPTPRRRVFVEASEVPGDQPVFALRGFDPAGKAVGVFLHGHCSHGMGYLQAFQYAAAEAGRFIALQGDVHCGSGPMRAWSGDTDALDRRIDRALEAYLGAKWTGEVVVGGSSQGVERAVALARRFPKKYRRLILSSGFREISPTGLDEHVHAYFLIGEHDNVWPTKRTVQRWEQAGLHVGMQVIPGAGHGDFHGQGDRRMREALRFVMADGRGR